MVEDSEKKPEEKTDEASEGMIEAFLMNFEDEEEERPMVDDEPMPPPPPPPGPPPPSPPRNPYVSL